MFFLLGERYSKISGHSREISDHSTSAFCYICFLFYILNYPIFTCSQTNLTALSADTLPKKATVDMRTSVPSTTQASMDLLCETGAFPSKLEGAFCDLAAINFPVALWWLLWGCSTHHTQSVTPTPIHHLPIWSPELCFITGVHCALFWSSLRRLTFRNPSLLPLPPGSSSPSPTDCWTGNLFGAVFLRICPPNPQ